MPFNVDHTLSNIHSQHKEWHKFAISVRSSEKMSRNIGYCNVSVNTVKTLSADFI